MTAPATATGRSHASDTWFYVGMGLLAFAVVFAGFGQSLYGIATGTSSLPTIVKLHSVCYGSWLFLFIVQTVLVAKRNVALHRWLGMAAVALALAMLVVGYLTAIGGIHRGFDLAGKNDPLGYSVFPLGDLVSFTVFVTAGFLWRRHGDAHKRLMLLATVGTLLNAPLAHFIAHLPQLKARGAMVIIPMMLVLLFASAIYDRWRYGRIHPVSLWGAIGLFVYGNLRAGLIGPSHAWHQFAAWLSQLEFEPTLFLKMFCYLRQEILL